MGKKPPELAREPASPISYGQWTRRADRRNGRRDGLRRIPSLAEVTALVHLNGPAQLPTPYLEMLLNRARDMMEHERLLFLASTATARAEQAELRSWSAAPRAAVEAARTGLERAREELTEDELQARNVAELQHSAVFLRTRREAQRAHRIANAEAVFQEALDAQREYEHRLARVTEMIESRLAIGRLRALRISAYAAARIATYWEGLVRVHRDGTHLAPLLPYLSPRLPDWIFASASSANASTPEQASPAVAGPAVAGPAVAGPAVAGPADSAAPAPSTFYPDPTIAASPPEGPREKIQPQQPYPQPVPAHG